MRRATDRAETVVLILLAVVFLVGAPVSALTARAGVHAAAERDYLAQHAARYQVTATIEGPAGKPAGGGNLTAEVAARWIMPDGKVVHKKMVVAIGYLAGSTLPVWTTRTGELTTPPMAEAQVNSLTDLATVGGVAVFALAVTVAGALARWCLNRRRMAAWDADWRVTGPRWTTRA